MCYCFNEGVQRKLKLLWSSKILPKKISTICVEVGSFINETVRVFRGLTLWASTGVEIREFFSTGHKFTNLLRSVSWTWFTRMGKFWLFSPQDHHKMAFPYLKGKLNLLERKIKKKLTLKNASKVAHFTYFFLHECSMYSYFEFELKK